jgi:hypothetical protein
MITDVLLMQYRFAHYVLKTNTEGMDHADSLVQPQPAGNCANWVLGHILVSRNMILRLLGAEPLLGDDESQPYRRGSAPLGDGAADAVSFEKLLGMLDASQETIMERLPTLDDEALAREVTGPFGKPEQLGNVIGALHFHEAYHAGQIGVIRRLLGREGAIK